MHARRPPGRPRGQFQQKQDQLFEHLKGEEQPVDQTTEHLAQKLGTSERQVERYIKALVNEKRIRISRCRTNLGQGWANKRYIYVIE